MGMMVLSVGDDDDPDEAQLDDDDDGDDLPPPGGNSPGRFLPAGELFLSLWFPPRGGSGIPPAPLLAHALICKYKVFCICSGLR